MARPHLTLVAAPLPPGPDVGLGNPVPANHRAELVSAFPVHSQGPLPAKAEHRQPATHPCRHRKALSSCHQKLRWYHHHLPSPFRGDRFGIDPDKQPRGKRHALRGCAWLCQSAAPSGQQPRCHNKSGVESMTVHPGGRRVHRRVRETGGDL